MLRYLDNWLILASSWLEALQARDKVLNLCQTLGIVVNLKKFCLVPSQTAIYLGMVLVSPSLRAFPTEKLVSTLLTQITEFLSCWQEAKHHLLATSFGSASLPLSPCSRRSSPNAVPSSRVEGPAGFRQRVNDVILDSRSSQTSLGGQTLVICWQASLLSTSNWICSSGQTHQIRVGEQISLTVLSPVIGPSKSRIC